MSEHKLCFLAKETQWCLRSMEVFYTCFNRNFNYLSAGAWFLCSKNNIAISSTVTRPENAELQSISSYLKEGKDLMSITESSF